METKKPFFVNLSNHPVAGWSAEQRDAALALGLGEPADLPGGMPLVDPAWDELRVAELARELVRRALDAGAKGAHVAGEFTLTFALVRALATRGVLCFAATTRRETSSEQQPDGSAHKQATFRFVRWRQYVEA